MSFLKKLFGSWVGKSESELDADADASVAKIQAEISRLRAQASAQALLGQVQHFQRAAGLIIPTPGDRADSFYLKGPAGKPFALGLHYTQQSEKPRFQYEIRFTVLQESGDVELCSDDPDPNGFSAAFSELLNHSGDYDLDARAVSLLQLCRGWVASVDAKLTLNST